MPKNPIEKIYYFIHFPIQQKTYEKSINEDIPNLIESLQHNPLIITQTLSLTQPPRAQFQKYFYYYLWNLGLDYIADVLKRIDSLTNEYEKFYMLNYELSRTISPLLYALSKKLDSNRHNFIYSNKRNQNNYDDNYYVGYLLKEILTFSYITIQNKYGKYLLQDSYEQGTLENKFFSKHSRISYSSWNEKSHYWVKHPKRKPKNLGYFVAPQKDIKPKLKSLPTYDEIIFNANKMREIEFELYKDGIINAELNFIPCKANSHKRLLAAVYYELINHGYFKKHFDRANRNFTPSDYRKFMDNRYSVDTDQQFRKLNSKQREFALENLPWLKTLDYLF